MENEMECEHRFIKLDCRLERVVCADCYEVLKKYKVIRKANIYEIIISEENTKLWKTEMQKKK